MAPAIGTEVGVDFALAVRFGRDHGEGTPVVEFGAEPVGVEGSVTEEHVEFHALDQRLYLNHIMGLPKQQHDANKISQRIDQGYGLNRQTIARTADRLTMTPLALVPCR